MVKYLTCGVFAEDVCWGITWLAVSSSIDSRHSELVFTSLQQTRDLQTGVIDGIGPIHPGPPIPEMERKGYSETENEHHYLRKWKQKILHLVIQKSFQPGAALLSFVYNVVLDFTASIALRLQPLDDDVFLSHCCGRWCAWLGWECWERERDVQGQSHRNKTTSCLTLPHTWPNPEYIIVQGKKKLFKLSYWSTI